MTEHVDVTHQSADGKHELLLVRAMRGPEGTALIEIGEGDSLQMLPSERSLEQISALTLEPLPGGTDPSLNVSTIHDNDECPFRDTDWIETP